MNLNKRIFTYLLSGKAIKKRYSEFWYDEDGLFNLDDEGRAEKQQCAVAASNIIRNFSFMPDNEMIMAQHRHSMETLFQCLEDQNSGNLSEFLSIIIRFLLMFNLKNQ